MLLLAQLDLVFFGPTVFHSKVIRPTELCCRGLFSQVPHIPKSYAWYDRTAGQFLLKQAAIPQTNSSLVIQMSDLRDTIQSTLRNNSSQCFTRDGSCTKVVQESVCIDRPLLPGLNV